MSDRLREIVNMRNFHENSLHTTGEILNRYGYKLGRTIGYGSYCKVRIALKMTEDRKRVACKSIDKRKASSDYVGKFLPREINILKSIEHPNIVSIHDIFLINDQVHIFMDLCEKGDLLEYICCKGPIPENKAKHFFRQLVSALEYLHNMEISHRDIKCENILLSSGNVLKITDFGFARLCRDKKGNRILSDTFCGSTAYAAPEILQARLTSFLFDEKAFPSVSGMSYNPKMYDMWSLGCVLYIMLAASMPFDDSNIRNMLKTMINKNITFPPHCDGTLSPAAVHLVW
ncbi:hypothetical protein J437_LFUL004720 [Ladona fulva]|uniref:Protein kinase domain-containing protein n=1 Tax=Ladona fulva TaxID=123851 RepID=A0A8K0JWU9_LADFU|nr:hypothetical protein J437_LFUL004720 [Ladona fulva]